MTLAGVMNGPIRQKLFAPETLGQLLFARKVSMVPPSLLIFPGKSDTRVRGSWYANEILEWLYCCPLPVT